MFKSVGKILGNAIEFSMAFPCIACGSHSTKGKNMFCEECLSRLKLVKPPLCPGCGGEIDTALELCSNCLREEPRVWDKAISMFSHEGLARQLLHRFKYRDTPEVARAFGLLAAETLKATGYKPQSLVPVPLHWTRSFMRGFNQAELICKVMSEQTGIPVEHALRRSRRTKQQAKLSRNERKKNLIEAFSINDRKFHNKGTILLFDDVMTTGSTLQAASQVLKDNGAKEIIIMVIARRQ